MGNDMPTKLTIVTSMAIAIRLHPLTHRSIYSRHTRSFLEKFDIEFHEPSYNQAIFEASSYAPERTWYGLFDKTEKIVMEEEGGGFYGIQYKTQVKLTHRRVEELADRLEKTIQSQSQIPKDAPMDYQVRRKFYLRDEVRDIEDALERFNEEDQITLTFIFSEWPTIEEAKRRDYIKEFEKKLLKIVSQSESGETPF